MEYNCAGCYRPYWHSQQWRYSKAPTKSLLLQQPEGGLRRSSVGLQLQQLRAPSFAVLYNCVALRDFSSRRQLPIATFAFIYVPQTPRCHCALLVDSAGRRKTFYHRWSVYIACIATTMQIYGLIAEKCDLYKGATYMSVFSYKLPFIRACD